MEIEKLTAKEIADENLTINITDYQTYEFDFESLHGDNDTYISTKAFIIEIKKVIKTLEELGQKHPINKIRWQMAKLELLKSILEDIEPQKEEEKK